MIVALCSTFSWYDEKVIVLIKGKSQMGTHLHITAWVLGIILFFVAFALAGKTIKALKLCI